MSTLMFEDRYGLPTSVWMKDWLVVATCYHRNSRVRCVDDLYAWVYSNIVFV